MVKVKIKEGKEIDADKDEWLYYKFNNKSKSWDYYYVHPEPNEGKLYYYVKETPAEKVKNGYWYVNKPGAESKYNLLTEGEFRKIISDNEKDFAREELAKEYLPGFYSEEVEKRIMRPTNKFANKEYPECPEGKIWVKSHRDKFGKYIRGYCRSKSNEPKYEENQKWI